MREIRKEPTGGATQYAESEACKQRGFLNIPILQTTVNTANPRARNLIATIRVFPPATVVSRTVHTVTPHKDGAHILLLCQDAVKSLRWVCLALTARSDPLSASFYLSSLQPIHSLLHGCSGPQPQPGGNRISNHGAAKIGDV